MAHPQATGFVVTVRCDAANEQTVILHDQDGNEIASAVFALVPTGVRVDVWNADDTHAGQVIAR